MASNLLDTAWRNFLQAGTKNKVGQAILPADTLSSVSRRRLKAGGSQDWLPHNSTGPPETSPSDTPAGRRAPAPLRSPSPPPPPRDRKSTRLNSSHLGIS